MCEDIPIDTFYSRLHRANSTASYRASIETLVGQNNYIEHPNNKVAKLIGYTSWQTLLDHLDTGNQLFLPTVKFIHIFYSSKTNLVIDIFRDQLEKDGLNIEQVDDCFLVYPMCRLWSKNKGDRDIQEKM